MNLVKSLFRLRLLYVLEKWMNWNTTCLARQVLSLVIYQSLIIVVETNLFRCQKSKTSDFQSMFFCQSNKVSSIFCFRVSVVNNYTVTFIYLLLCNLITLLLCFQCISVDSWVFWHVILPKSWLSWSWTTNINYHLLLNVFNSFGHIFLSHNQLTILWNSFRIESLYCHFLFLTKENVFRS